MLGTPPLSRALVLVSVQTRSRVSNPVSWKTAFELSRYSVPPLAVLYLPAGDCAGQTVKPGTPSGWSSRLASGVSYSTPLTAGPLGAGRWFGKALILGPL